MPTLWPTLRAAALAVALVVMITPVPYLERSDISIGFTMEHDVSITDHTPFTFRSTFRAHGEKRERLTLAWWLAAAGLLVWTELERRGRIRRETLAPPSRALILCAATAALYLREVEIFRFGSLDARVGTLLVDTAGAVYALATLAGFVASRRRGASRSPTVTS